MSYVIFAEVTYSINKMKTHKTAFLKSCCQILSNFLCDDTFMLEHDFYFPYVCDL